MRYIARLILASVTIYVISPLAFSAEPTTKVPPKSLFAPPYPERIDPFRQPINSDAISVRRDANVQQVDLKLRGFIDVGDRKAILEINGKIVALATGETRHDIQLIEMTAQGVTLQRGRYRWTESLLARPVPESSATSAP